MSIYATIAALGRPYRYQGSHILPTDDDLRDGDVQLAEVPSHITRDGRNDQPEDDNPWPWLRLSVNDADVILDPAQARYLAEQLADWADRADSSRR